jgi:hypothetical protein
VKRLDSFLKWFGLASIATAVLYFLFDALVPNSPSLFSSHPYVVNHIIGIVCVVLGAPCAVCGLLRADPTHSLALVLNVSKYIGLICWICAALLMDGYNVGMAFAAGCFVAWTVSVVCAVMGMKSRGARPRHS